MTRVLVIGYGNPLCGDDGIGWHAVRALGGEVDGDEVRTLFCEQLTPDLAEAVSLSRRVIFIDASIADEPGHVSSARVRPSPEPTGSFSHDITPGSLLAWSQALYGARPEAVLISVGAESFEIGECLSPCVAKSLPALLACVREQIAVLRSNHGGK